MNIIVINSTYFRRFSNDIAKYVAEKICEDFPTEVVKTYYISPIKKKNAVDNISKASKGKLVSMWRNKRNRNKKFLGTITKTIEKVANDVPDGIILYFYLIICIMFKFSYYEIFYFL